MLTYFILSLTLLAARALAQLPPNVDKIRGVNFGSFLVVEPYMMQDYWDNDMGADGSCAEYDYVQKVGQEQADAKFKEHWDTFITEDDVKLMKSYGLNTVRIPVGFWIVESLKQSDDFYPNGGMFYLDRALGWLKDQGIAALVDLHAVPGAATPNNAFAGRCSDTAFFWGNANQNYERAAQALANFTERAHKNPNWSTVFALEVLNEPPQDANNTPGYADYLAQATKAIRDKEADLKVDSPIAITYMSKTWQYAGNGPNPHDAASGVTLYDDHKYYSFGDPLPSDNTAQGHIGYACYNVPQQDGQDADAGNTPVVWGEWWLDGHPTCDECQSDDFLKRFGEAQRVGYDNGAGWIFWSWRYRGENKTRAYKDAVAAGLINKDAGQYDNPNICTSSKRVAIASNATTSSIAASASSTAHPKKRTFVF